MKKLSTSNAFPTSDFFVSFPYRFRIVSVSFPYHFRIVLLSFSYRSPIKLLSRSGKRYDNDTQRNERRTNEVWWSKVQSFMLEVALFVFAIPSKASTFQKGIVAVATFCRKQDYARRAE